jgi:hypothetical protein
MMRFGGTRRQAFCRGQPGQKSRHWGKAGTVAPRRVGTARLAGTTRTARRRGDGRIQDGTGRRDIFQRRNRQVSTIVWQNLREFQKSHRAKRSGHTGTMRRARVTPACCCSRRPSSTTYGRGRRRANLPPLFVGTSFPRIRVHMRGRSKSPSP